jgi:hypothetical protein
LDFYGLDLILSPSNSSLARSNSNPTRSLSFLGVQAPIQRARFDVEGVESRIQRARPVFEPVRLEFKALDLISKAFDGVLRRLISS